MNWLVAPPSGEAPAASVRASPLLKASRAVHRLVSARLEGHAGDVAATCAHGLVHLPRLTRCTALVATAGGVRASIAFGPPRSAAIWAARWLAESPAGIEVLLAGGKGKTLATIAAGQCHVARHVVDGSLGKRIKKRTICPAGTSETTGMRGFRRHENRFSSLWTRNSASRASLAGPKARAPDRDLVRKRAAPYVRRPQDATFNALWNWFSNAVTAVATL